MDQQVELLHSIQWSLNTLNIKLFGDATVENEKGRFPQLEAAVKGLTDRVDKLEKALIRYTAMATVVGFLGSAAVYALFHWLIK
jgi:hypothetical protein